MLEDGSLGRAWHLGTNRAGQKADHDLLVEILGLGRVLDPDVEVIGVLEEGARRSHQLSLHELVRPLDLARRQGEEVRRRLVRGRLHHGHIRCSLVLDATNHPLHRAPTVHHRATKERSCQRRDLRSRFRGTFRARIWIDPGFAGHLVQRSRICGTFRAAIQILRDISCKPQRSPGSRSLKKPRDVSCSDPETSGRFVQRSRNLGTFRAEDPEFAGRFVQRSRVCGTFRASDFHSNSTMNTMKSRLERVQNDHLDLQKIFFRRSSF